MDDVEWETCPDCNGEGALDCDQCGSTGMGDECETCEGTGEIESTKENDE